MNHIRLIIALSVPVLLIFTGLAGISNQHVKAQSPGDAGKYLRGLTNNICKDNPLKSQGIPTITIPGNVSGKNGGVTAYGNANSENGKNGPISIGGGADNGKDNGISSVGGGNGGIALCGSSNGK